MKNCTIKVDGGSALIEQWLKNKDTVLFWGVWEQLNIPDFIFNSSEFEGVKNEVVRNSFFLTTKKWIEDRCGKSVLKGGVTEAALYHAVGDESEPRKPRKGRPA